MQFMILSLQILYVDPLLINSPYFEWIGRLEFFFFLQRTSRRIGNIGQTAFFRPRICGRARRKAGVVA